MFVCSTLVTFYDVIITLRLIRELRRLDCLFYASLEHLMPDLPRLRVHRIADRLSY